MDYPFFGTAGEMTNGIEDPMSYTADPAQSMTPSTALEALKTSGIVCSGYGNVNDASSVGNTMDVIGIQGVKGNRKCPVTIGRGNMFAKKINIGDNFSGLGEYIYKYMDFFDGMEDPGAMLMPAGEAACREGVLIKLKNMKGFLKRY
jgi:hypothetical protein